MNTLKNKLLKKNSYKKVVEYSKITFLWLFIVLSLDSVDIEMFISKVKKIVIEFNFSKVFILHNDDDDEAVVHNNAIALNKLTNKVKKATREQKQEEKTIK